MMPEKENRTKQGHGGLKLTIRLDDITPDMNMEKFRRFSGLMDAHGIKPLLGVVPDPKDESLDYTGGDEMSKKARRERFWTMIRQLQMQGYQVAMHGLTHVYTTSASGLFPLNRQSEFAGRPYEEQAEMIRKGKEILSSHGITTDIFMAPSHTFDKNTIRALLENGFTKMTDGFGTRAYRYLGMVFYPISFLRRKSVERAQRERGEGSNEHSVTLVVHTNTLNDKDFAAYEQIFKTCAFLPYDALYAQPVKELSKGRHAAHFLMATSKRVARKAT